MPAPPPPSPTPVAIVRRSPPRDPNAPTPLERTSFPIRLGASRRSSRRMEPRPSPRRRTQDPHSRLRRRPCGVGSSGACTMVRSQSHAAQRLKPNTTVAPGDDAQVCGPAESAWSAAHQVTRRALNRGSCTSGPRCFPVPGEVSQGQSTSWTRVAEMTVDGAALSRSPSSFCASSRVCLTASACSLRVPGGHRGEGRVVDDHDGADVARQVVQACRTSVRSARPYLRYRASAGTWCGACTWRPSWCQTRCLGTFAVCSR